MSEEQAYQLPIPIISHEIEESPINQRAIDGYINATEMCKAAGKRFNDYSRLSTTSAYLVELSPVTGIPVTELIQQIQGGIPEFQGTWVHPQVAIHLAQWLSPKFAVQVSQWVLDWFGGQHRSNLPSHVRRYVINQHKIPPTHFSMLNQMIFRLLAPLEIHGYILPDKMIPDIALGRMFSKWCREQGYNPDEFPSYQHEFLDNRPTVPARLYPNTLITDFNRQLDYWLRDGRAEKYFIERAPSSVEPLGKVLALPSPTPNTNYPSSDGARGKLTKPLLPKREPAPVT